MWEEEEIGGTTLTYDDDLRTARRQYYGDLSASLLVLRAAKQLASAATSLMI